MLNVMNKLEKPKHKIKQTKPTNSSEVLSRGRCSKTKKTKTTILEDSLVNKPQPPPPKKKAILEDSLVSKPPQKKTQQLLGGLGLGGVSKDSVRIVFFWFTHQRVSQDCFLFLLFKAYAFFRVQQLRCPWQYWCCELISVDP